MRKELKIRHPCHVPAKKSSARAASTLPTLAGAGLAAEAMQMVGRVRAAIMVKEKEGKKEKKQRRAEF